MSTVMRALSLFALAIGFAVVGAPVTSAQPQREPLPLDVVVSLRSHNGRSPVDLSPDGEWVAHTYGRDETVPRQTVLVAAGGFPFAEGNARMHAAITHTKTGQVIRLGGDNGSSWGAVWSPDGQRPVHDPEFLDEHLDITRDDRGRMILHDGCATGRSRTGS